MNENEPLHFGERFGKARLYIKNKFKLDFFEIASECGVDQATASRWQEKEIFKRSTLLKLENLRKFGINPLYFKERDAEMLLPEADKGLEEEIIKAFTEIGETLIEQGNDLKELLTAIKSQTKEIKHLRDEVESLKNKRR